MGRQRQQPLEKGWLAAVPLFFKATLLLWFLSLIVAMKIEGRTNLWPILAGCIFYQTANYAVKVWLSKDPLFINTAVSLLHSTITSISGTFLIKLCFVAQLT